MRRRDLLRTMALTPLVPAWPLRPDLTPGPNAVDLYLEAIAKLPALSEADNVMLADVEVARLDRKAEDLVVRATPAIDLLKRGAAAACDWGNSFTGPDWFEKLAPWLTPGRALARLAALRARFAFAAGRPDAGLDDLLAPLNLGRHLGQALLMITQIMGLSIEHITIGVAGLLLPRLDRERLGTFEKRFRLLPRPPNLAETIAAERAFAGRAIEAQDEADRDPEAEDRALAWCDHLAEVAGRSEVEFDAVRAEPGATADMKQFLDAIQAYRGARTFAAVKRSLLLAGIAVVADGPNAIGRVTDPTDARPFDLRSWATGFEMTSRFALDRKPKASLVVGHR